MSEIAERIQFNARRSAEYCDGVVLSDASIDQIIQAETGYEKEIGALRTRIAELESFLCLGEQLDHLLECYGESDEPMTKGAEAIRDWMQEHVIKPKQRIAELEKSAIVWHRYPEEKPPKKDLYVIYFSSRNLAREDLWDNDKQRWDHTPEDSQHLITHWAYLPAPPEEVSND